MAVTSGIIPGNLRMLYMDDVLVGCTTENSMSITNEQIETSCKDGTANPTRTYENGAKDVNFAGSMNVKFDDENQYRRVLEAAIGSTEHTWKYATANTEDPYLQFDGKVQSLNETAGFNATLTASFTIVPTSDVYLFNT